MWYLDKMKINKGADGLVLKAEDIMKIGQLMLQGGVYNGRRIVSSEWIKETTRPNLLTYDFIGHYGMHWWVHKLDESADFTPENTFYFALGFGGQYIIVFPAANRVITMTSDIYTDSLRPMRILRKTLLKVN